MESDAHHPVVGVIGTGAMGGAMAARLLDQCLVVQVRDIDLARQRALEALGAIGQPTPARLADAADTIFVVVVNALQIDAVLAGPDGLLDHLTPDHAIVFCSTISPHDMDSACRSVIGRGAAALDAPISGGPRRARDGTMTMMLAGDPAPMQRLGPLLDRLTSRRFEISATPGDASKAKLVNNLVAGINLAAAAEGLALARELGLDEQQMFALMSASSAQSWIGDDRLARALADDYSPRAQTQVLTKDLTLATALAGRHRYPAPMGAAALQLFEAACEAGHAEEDDAALLKFRRAWRAAL